MITTATPWVYTATVLDVHDGDTVTLDVTLLDADLGFTIRAVHHWTMKIRLAHIQAPELTKPGGPQSRDFLRSLIQVGSTVVLHTIKDQADKYGGRYDGELYLTTDTAHSLNDQMVAAGHAVYWDGTGPKPAGT